MRLDLTKLFKTRDSALPFAFEREMDDLQLYGEQLAFTTPVRFAGKVTFADDVFIIEGKITAGYSAACGRCGSETHSELAIDVLEEFARAEDEEHPDRYIFTGDSIDFSPMVEEMIVLNMPLKHLCREDCRGVCPVCRTNWNLRDCPHRDAVEHQEERRNPFEALGALLQDNNEEE